METLVCPKGHQSSDRDYCSECGAKIGNGIGNGAGNGSGPVAAAAADVEACPDCGTRREHKGVTFCEICGYNFMTGARGELPVSLSASMVMETPQAEHKAEPVPERQPEAVSAEAARAAWTVEVSVDQSSRQPDSPEPPVDVSAVTVELSKTVNLIGRTSQTRAIFPEISIDYDDAVSHRHALLQFDADGELAIRDIGAANGTQLNGNEIKAMADHPLKDGDEIRLGHWSKIRVTRSVKAEV